MVERRHGFRVSFTSLYPNMKKPDLVQVVTVLAIIVVTYPLLFPAGIGHQRERGKSEPKTAVVSIVAALKAYHSEYGKWPDYTGDGLFLDETRNAQLMRTLRALDEVNNPRKIVFFEGGRMRQAKRCIDHRP